MATRLSTAFIVAMAAGCAAGPRGQTESPGPVPWRDAAGPEAGSGPGNAEPEGPITLQRALALALVRSPELAAVAHARRAADARRLQAGLIPNPEIEVESEDVGGELRGFRESETTVFLGQPIELGGKRAARIEAAEAERRLAAWDYEAKKLDVLTETSRSFVALLGAQRRAALAEETVRVAREVVRAAESRVRAGAASPIEVRRARIALSGAEIEARRGRAEREAARKRLAAQWGAAEARFTEAAGELEIDLSLPDPGKLQAGIRRNPDVARWETEIERRKTGIRRARSLAFPDVTVGGGYRWLAETDRSAFTLGLALPLPLFDRNQGGIAEAYALLDRAHEQRRAAEARAIRGLARAHAELRAAAQEVATLRDEILPAARQTFEAVAKGYRGGKFDYLALLDAQRTLAEGRMRYAEALVRLREAKLDVERWIGGPLEGASTDATAKPPSPPGTR